MLTGDEWGRGPLGEVRVLGGGKVVHRRAAVDPRDRRLRRRGPCTIAAMYLSIFLSIFFYLSVNLGTYLHIYVSICLSI